MPRKLPRARGDVARQALRAVQLLRAAPRRRADLMDELGISRSSASRILRAIADVEQVDVEKRGREAFYRVR